MTRNIISEKLSGVAIRCGRFRACGAMTSGSRMGRPSRSSVYFPVLIVLADGIDLEGRREGAPGRATDGSGEGHNGRHHAEHGER
jgi:hypothetical protein